MRGFLIAAAASAAMIAAPAWAQHRSGGGHAAGQWRGSGQMHDGWQGHRGGSWHWTGPGQRWGGTIQGRWYGGAGAPGGWASYRRPVRGWVLPSYWVSPSWTVWDWADYDLPRPPRGYVWSRYYDDAVLIDRSGQVYDSRDEMDWGGYDQGYDDGYRDGYDDGLADDGVPPPPPPVALPRGYGQRPEPLPPIAPQVRFGPPAEVVQPLDGGGHVVTRCAGDCASDTVVTIPARPRVVTTTSKVRSKTVARKTVPRKTVHVNR
ncbi:MAG TPA: RcnB family protein [Sphingomonas sp.]|nr:RcnB family protein [Sphingomonas sp.]